MIPYLIIIYLIFGIMPSLIWLAYYLRKDPHPEPQKMIIKIFLWGSLITLPVFFIQIGFKNALDSFNINYLLGNLIYWFLIIATTEELFKYLVVKIKAVGTPDFDEPVDAIIYMVIAALGFAAVENTLYLFSPIGDLSFNQLLDRTLVITFIRSIGATFLHTLCSAVIGYSLALSFCQIKTRKISVAMGIFVAALLHGLYNFSIMTLEGSIRFYIPLAIILTLALIVFSGIEKLKRMKSICKV